MAKDRIVRSKDAEQFDEESELWDSRQLGASWEHARWASDEDDKALDDALGLQLLSFRIQKSVIERLKQLAKLEGIGYQPFMRQILQRYVRENEHKLRQLLSPHEASEQAEDMFVEAFELKERIPALKELTRERIDAEHDYSVALGAANILYRHASQNCADPVLKKHLDLRLAQISAWLGEDRKVPHDPPRKTRKKRAS